MSYLNKYVPGTVSVVDDFDDRLGYRSGVPLENGRFVVFYGVGLSPNTWGFRVFNSDGTAVTDPVLGFSSDASRFNATVTDVSALPDGGFLVTWLESVNNESFFLSQYDADGRLVDFVANFVSIDVFTTDPLRDSNASLDTSVSGSGAVLHTVEDGSWKLPLRLSDPIPDDALSKFLTFTGSGPGPLGPTQFASDFNTLGADFNDQLDLAFVTDDVAVAVWRVSNNFLQPRGVYGQLLFADGTEASEPFAIYRDDRLEGGIFLTPLENDRFAVFFYDGDDGDSWSFQIFNVAPDDNGTWVAQTFVERTLIDLPRDAIFGVNPTIDGGFLVKGNAFVHRFDSNGIEMPFDAVLFNFGDAATSEIFLDDVIQLTTGEFVSFASRNSRNSNEPAYVVATIFDQQVDDIIGTIGPDILDGTPLGEELIGLSGADVINALGGDDTLDGGSGVDSLSGGLGDDLFIVDNVSDIVREFAGQGEDSVESSVSYNLNAVTQAVEVLTLTGASDINGTGNTIGNIINGNAGRNSLVGAAGDDTLNGNGGFDTLNGGAGQDSLDGGIGQDSLLGGDGDDIYIVDNPFDIVREFANVQSGTDSVFARISYNLNQQSQNIENLTLTGTSFEAVGNSIANTLTGNASNNRLVGAAGDDTLTGAAGNDTLLGGADADRLDGGAGVDRNVGGFGDDTYLVNDFNDRVVEFLGEGLDTVLSTVTFSLLFNSNNIEVLTLQGAGNINGSGNNAANVINGNSGNNVLNGASGFDELIGNGGNDTLNGGFGEDTLAGGAAIHHVIAGTARQRILAKPTV
ncbi:MAG: calcium-binding protein, partial [Pseudomonadota bacterium]